MYRVRGRVLERPGAQVQEVSRATAKIHRVCLMCDRVAVDERLFGCGCDRCVLDRSIGMAVNKSGTR